MGPKQQADFKTKKLEKTKLKGPMNQVRCLVLKDNRHYPLNDYKGYMAKKDITRHKKKFDKSLNYKNLKKIIEKNL